MALVALIVTDGSDRSALIVTDGSGRSNRHLDCISHILVVVFGLFFC